MDKQKTKESAMPEKDVFIIGEQSVADYLRLHPGFFEDKPSLLSDLRVPHAAGNAVSLVERQVAVLRDGNESLQKQLNNLIHIARVNDQLNMQLHELTLCLVGNHNLEALLDVITYRLRQDFSADVVAVHLLASPRDPEYASRPEFEIDADTFCGSFQRLLSAGKPYCGRLKTEQLQILFDGQMDAVGSTAFLPLGETGSLGVLAIGSFDRHRFAPDADTAFLGRMAAIVAAALRPQLSID